ncbi:MAG: PTS sugar transporter subunit IIA [Promicromonosporaceae bacterium]|nr:PTS sugar transporter subunit IIA [Promicromonosporaceae bacterium]
MSDVLTLELVKVPGTARTRDDAIREAGQLLVDVGAVNPEYVDAMLQRESSVSTFMGNGLAIPHGTNESKGAILRTAMSLVRYDEPVDWAGNPARVVVGIAGVGDEHLEILGKIAVLFADSDQAQRVIDAPDALSVYRILESVNA